MNGYLWMVVSSLMFAFLRVFVRLASPHAPWAEVGAVRTVTGAIISIALARTMGTSLRIDRPRDAWARSIFGTLGLLFLYIALSNPKINVGDVAVLTATSPILVALVAPYFLNERSDARVWTCAGISFAGIVLIAQPKFDTAGPVALVAIASAITSGLGNVFMRRLGPYASAEAIVLHFAVVSAVALGAMSIWTWRWPSVTGWLIMGATGVTGCFGQLAQTRAYALVPAGRIGIFGYLATVLTQLVAVGVLGEKLSLHQIAGSTLIVGSGIALARARASGAASEPAQVARRAA